MAAILIIDDDEAVLTTLHEALARAGHRVAICPDSRKFLDELKAHSADLLITDVFMEGVDGLEIISRVRAAFPQLKIIAISGGIRLTHQDFLPVARRLGANATLQKPIDLTALLETVTRLLTATS